MPTVEESVVVPDRLDTGRIKEIDDDNLKVELDFLQSELVLSEGEVRVFRYKHRSSTGRFLVIAKAYHTPFSKKRHLKIQYHCIRNDGSVGARVNRLHRVNGITKRGL